LFNVLVLGLAAEQVLIIFIASYARPGMSRFAATTDLLTLSFSLFLVMLGFGKSQRKSRFVTLSLLVGGFVVAIVWAGGRMFPR